MESVISLGEQLPDEREPEGEYRKKQTKNRNILKSLDNGLTGIFIVIKEERNFRLHMLAVFLVSLAGWAFKISKFEWFILVIFYGLVMSAEMFNSVLEDVYDLLREEADISYQLTGKGKDIASGAVLVLSFAAVVAACLIFLPRIFELF